MSKYQVWKSFEGEVARKLKLAGFTAKRNWSTQFSEKSGVDVLAEKGDLKFLIQCKYGEKPNLRKAYLEAVAERKGKEIPLAVCRFKKERDTLVVIGMSDFLRILVAEKVR